VEHPPKAIDFWRWKREKTTPERVIYCSDYLLTRPGVSESVARTVALPFDAQSPARVDTVNLIC
jgi:hypothetical protein